MNIDKRKNYFLVLDTEVANLNNESGLDFDRSSGLVYDIGLAVIDKKGQVYENYSFIIEDVFDGHQEAMETAYYSDKVPMYLDWLEDGYIEKVRFYEVRRLINDLHHRYDFKAIMAYNMAFDNSVLNATQRYLTKSAGRYFLPYNVELWCIMRMWQSTIAKRESYQAFCQENNFITARGRAKETAEVAYRYIHRDTDFIESHTGLEDALIEAEIFAYIMKQNKKTKKSPYTEKRITKQQKLDWQLP